MARYISDQSLLIFKNFIDVADLDLFQNKINSFLAAVQEIQVLSLVILLLNEVIWMYIPMLGFLIMSYFRLP